MKDSTGKLHSPLVKDMLANTYNLMIKNKFDVNNPTEVLRAENQLLGHSPNEKYCKRFVSELTFIRRVASHQPTVIVTYNNKVFSESENQWVALKGTETAILKTYNREKLENFVKEWENKGKKYFIRNIEIKNEIYLDYNE